MKHWFFRHYWWLILLAGIGAIVLAIATSPKVEWQLLLGIVGSALSGIYFVQKQRLEEMNLFKEIFTECNRRYDSLNKRLNAIAAVPEDQPLSEDERNTLNDYFNLCAEEFLFFETGYILPSVWESWRNGILSFMPNKRISQYWAQEQRSGSYYGLTLDQKE
jgi:hypothetical protein